MSDRPQPAAPTAAADDALSALLRTIRLSGSLQFCFVAAGAWETDAQPAMAELAHDTNDIIPFHVVVEGHCWLRIEGREWSLAAGDIVAFPFGSGHQLGAGEGGCLVTPTRDLPPKPWREIPVMRYGAGPAQVRLLCGFLQCGALGFRPFRDSLPALLRASAAASEWLAASVTQMAAEAERWQPGGVSMLERLTEIVFLELLRHHIASDERSAVGWLAALADPRLAPCLALIHGQPQQPWTLNALASAAGVSRSALSERFETILGTSPMRYLRMWRLYLAGRTLESTGKSLAQIAFESGYATEAAFNRAFSRSFGVPPAAWRHRARQGAPP